MTARERIEQNERLILSERATLSENSRGREAEEPECSVRTCFMRDRDRIIHSKSFRRLKHKTQVFLSPEGDHYRTRLTHTLEVSQISRTIARALGLNEDLTEAIALGHDLGHTPFGHAGEKALDEICPEGFRHNEQSVRVVTKIENEGRGLNLTFEVRDGMRCHTGDKRADTLEGRIIHFSDRIAYINHDIDDAIRAGILKECDIPGDICVSLGSSHKERINTLVHSVIRASSGLSDVGLEPEHGEAMEALRKFMFEHVYRNPEAKGEEKKGIDILKRLYEYFISNTDRLPLEFKDIAESDGRPRAVCDYIAGMTDRYAITVYSDIFIPKGWQRV
ncbi:MAG: deoxyguanosinetriphosphate triphosphohydrolase [Bacillota bacterium]|nr:deoxyguanosinetriphosphate triphosphohydrolase [Bacillota bacterium]